MNLVHFIIRDSNGKAVRHGSCMPDVLSLQAKESETVAAASEEEIRALKIQLVAARRVRPQRTTAAMSLDERLDRVVAVLAYLDSKGIDLGPAAGDLFERPRNA